jgi:hypothetical protein
VLVHRRHVIVALTAATVAVGVAPAIAFRGERVFIAANCTTPSYRPTRFLLACGDGNTYVTAASFTSYGGKTAVAHGLIHTNGCLPDCAQGTFTSTPGTVVFHAIARCRDGRLFYTRARQGRYQWPVQPSSGCGRVLG